MLTLSVTDTLDYIAETAQPQAIVAQPVPHPVLPRPLNTKDVNDGLFGIADIYAGFVDVPYFFDMANPYGTWSAAGGGSLTRFNPVPEQTGTQRIPMLVTVPNAGSGQAKPVDGWPVVIYLPGLLIDRTTAIGIADAYAQAGFAVVAIDLPLHGVICPVDNLACNPFLVPPGNPAGILERHFYLDKFGSRESGYDPATPDGIIDDGGQAARIGTVGALGMPGPLWVRDLLRQGTSDLIHLRRSLDNLDLDGIAGGDIDTTKVNFMGFSTGSNIGVVFLGTDPGITTATLANGGGPWVYLLADPEAQGLGTIVKTVAAQLGAVPGSVRASYLQRDYMNAVDAGDVWNYAAKAGANTAINAHLVLTDQTVTNGASRSMAKAMKIPTVTTAGPIGSPLPGSPPISAMVEFSQGGHGSLLDLCAEVIDFGTQAVLSEPNPSVTVEMQTEAATFAATSGTYLPVSCTGADCVGGPPVSICTP
jgi:dienelactone hydrolase